MEDSINQALPWSAPPSAKARAVVQRAVNALLDALAPERTVTRTARAPARVEQYRTPSGCVLQAANAAASVSWFPDATNDAALGELRMTVWDGVVWRRGSPRRGEAARVVRELTLQPLYPSDEAAWRAEDGTTYDTAALVTACLTMLEERISAVGE